LPFTLGHACSVCGFTLFPHSGEKFDYEDVYGEDADYNAKTPDQILEHYRKAPNTAWALDRLAGLYKDKHGARLLEIGASQGAFLVLASELGFDVCGLELSPASVRYGIDSLGLVGRLKEGPWRDRHHDEQLVDVVCAFEVLEHATDPLDFLSMVRSWLRPGGHLLLSVPNARRLRARLGRRESQDHPPHHFTHWTRKALSSMVRRHGFRILETGTSPLTHSDLAGILAPSISRRRAADLDSFRPVGEEAAAAGLSRPLQSVYPVLTAIGRLLANTLNLVPGLGSRLMLLGSSVSDLDEQG
jgi:2-polyprenyl-3-methyl-5-hydroxy-6-metoxy-1,4-benzoquinol methylase